MLNKIHRRRKTFVENGIKKIPDPEEDRVALSIQKVLVQIGRIRPISDRSPQITSWFDAAFIQPNGSGSFGVTISPYLKPYLLQVKREFFKYNLGYVVRLRSSYSIRLYEWAKR